MKVTKGTKLQICHARHGTITVVAERDFDTDDEFYPVAATELIEGRTQNWLPGESVSCRGTFCKRMKVVE